MQSVARSRVNLHLVPVPGRHRDVSREALQIDGARAAERDRRIELDIDLIAVLARVIVRFLVAMLRLQGNRDSQAREGGEAPGDEHDRLHQLWVGRKATVRSSSTLLPRTLSSRFVSKGRFGSLASAARLSAMARSMIFRFASMIWTVFGSSDSRRVCTTLSSSAISRS